jgi:hypothetical protein
MIPPTRVILIAVIGLMMGATAQAEQTEREHKPSHTEVLVTGITVGGALLGVIVGAIITKGLDYVLAVRRERAEEKNETRKRTISIKAAARLIDEELYFGESVAEVIIESKDWWATDVELTTEAWKANRSTIVSELSGNDWESVVKGTLAVAKLSQYRHKSEERGTPPKIEIIRDLYEIIGKARLAIFPLGHPETMREIDAEREENAKKESKQ